MPREVCQLSIYCFSAPNSCFIVCSMTMDVGPMNKYFVFQLTVALLVEGTGLALKEGGVVLPGPGVLSASCTASQARCRSHSMDGASGAPLLPCTALEASIYLSISLRQIACSETLRCGKLSLTFSMVGFWQVLHIQFHSDFLCHPAYPSRASPANLHLSSGTFSLDLRC